MSVRFRLTGLALLLFTLIPILEIALLVEVGKQIGTWWTIALVLGTGLLGGVLIGIEGSGVIGRLKEQLAQGTIPQDPIIDGVLIIIGGLMLVTPGLLTDCLGFVLMFPLTRLVFRALIKRWIRQYFQLGEF